MMFNTFFSKLLGFCMFFTIAAKNTSYKYLGCFLEDNLLSLGEMSRVLNPLSPTFCSEFCSTNKYLFFILKDDTCYCSKYFISKLMKQFDHECTTKCIGDKKTSCGGTPNLVSSYTTNSSITNSFVQHGSFPVPIYLGCYFETPEDDKNRLLKGIAKSYADNTPQKCSVICFKKAYLYFGVTYGSECWCGNQNPSKSSKVKDVKCNSPCSGDSKQFCGGGWKMGIYSTGLTDYLANKYEGCFENGESKAKGKYLSFDLEGNNSPRRCMNLCNMQRFRYAAIKSNICECTNHKLNMASKRSFGDCNTVCTGYPSEYCGGSVTYNVYRTLYSDYQGNVKINRIGCFNNFIRHPILEGWIIALNRLTPKYCVLSCYARSFPYAALISSKECLCSFTKPSDKAKIENSMCVTPCSGSHQQLCGGNEAMDVYRTGLEWKTDFIGNYYLGCFEERENRRIFSDSRSLSTTNTPEFCSNVCYKLGYTYSGVTYIEGCFCGNQSPTDSKFPKVDDKQCNTRCSGDGNRFCGGEWRMGVFATGLHEFPIEDRYIGCFIMQDNTLENLKFELLYTNMPSKCSSLCNNAGYQFAGVIGVHCHCGNQGPQSDQKVIDTDCNTECIGDRSALCGGEDRIQIYDLMSN